MLDKQTEDDDEWINENILEFAKLTDRQRIIAQTVFVFECNSENVTQIKINQLIEKSAHLAILIDEALNLIKVDNGEKKC